MAIFNSCLYVYQRVYPLISQDSPMIIPIQATSKSRFLTHSRYMLVYWRGYPMKTMGHAEVRHGESGTTGLQGARDLGGIRGPKSWYPTQNGGVFTESMGKIPWKIL